MEAVLFFGGTKMPRRQWLPLLLPLLLGASLGSGCAPQLTVVQGAVEAPGVARVELRKIKKDLIDLQVVNTSPQPLTVDRDGFYLEGPTGALARIPGRGRRTSSVPPGAVRLVRMKFDRGALPHGAQVQLAMPQAILVEDQAVPMPPILLSTY
jgi:hypothetical protein